MSLYQADPRVRPVAIGAYPKRRRRVTVPPPLRWVNPDEPVYADFFRVEQFLAVAAH